MKTKWTKGGGKNMWKLSKKKWNQSWFNSLEINLILHSHMQTKNTFIFWKTHMWIQFTFRIPGILSDKIKSFFKNEVEICKYLKKKCHSVRRIPKKCYMRIEFVQMIFCSYIKQYRVCVCDFMWVRNIIDRLIQFNHIHTHTHDVFIIS